MFYKKIYNPKLSIRPESFTQTSRISILQNDDTQSSAPDYLGITITQVGDVLPVPAIGGITVNATGQVVVAPSTPIGTYTLQYYFTGSCGASNVATVTVDIADIEVIFEVEEKYRHMEKCFESGDSVFDFDFFNQNNWDGIGFLINSLPISPSLATVEVYGTPLPGGLTLNPDGIMNIPAFYYDEIEFYIVFRSTQNPSVTSVPIRCNFWIRPFGIPSGDIRRYDISLNSFYGSNTSPNLLIDDVIFDCPNTEIAYLPATSTNCMVEVTDNQFPFQLSISSTGILSVSGPLSTTESYILRYRICHPTIPNICSPEAEVRINVID